MRLFSLDVGAAVPARAALPFGAHPAQLCSTGITTASPLQPEGKATCAVAPDGALTGQPCSIAKHVPGYGCVCTAGNTSQPGVLVPLVSPNANQVLQVRGTPALLLCIHAPVRVCCLTLRCVHDDRVPQQRSIQCFIDNGCAYRNGLQLWGSRCYYTCAVELAEVHCATKIVQSAAIIEHTSVVPCLQRYVEQSLSPFQRCVASSFHCEPLPAGFAGANPPFACPSPPQGT